MFEDIMSKDDKVEIAANFLGSFILGASFAKDFFMHGRFEGRVFFFGVSCLVFFLAISFIAKIKIRIYCKEKKILSLFWIFTFLIGNFAAFELFKYQFKTSYINENIRTFTLIFLFCYSCSTNFLYVLNRAVLKNTLRPKTVYKYLLAPINGISSGVIITGLIVWFLY